ncbi:MAG: hypothetical protein J6K83_03060, partial [Bacteroidaceae bacterium]|nr:hypothetical protein [Bacteroidaceae bacterium]
LTKKIKGHVVLLVCMECCQGSSCFIAEQPCCFPKASAKVELFSELTNFLEEIFKKKREKINYAFLSAQFSKFSVKIYKNSKLLP